MSKLRESEMGCHFLLANWLELKANLDGTNRKFWQAIDRFKAVRLTGGHPADALERFAIAEIFVASHALHPRSRELGVFDDLNSDMNIAQRDRYVENVWESWPDLQIATDPAKATEILIDLCDAHIEDLTERLEVHAENADIHIEKSFAKHTLDQTPEGEKAARTSRNARAPWTGGSTCSRDT